MSPRRKINPYRKELVPIARKLRKNSTPGEIELWKGLKKKQILGYDFDRQKPIHKYIVDFYCKEIRLAIEIDGRSHDFKIGYDQKRQAELENLEFLFSGSLNLMQKITHKARWTKLNGGFLKTTVDPLLDPLQGGETLK